MAKSKAKQPKGSKKKNKKTIRNGIFTMLSGRVVSLDFFMRHKLMIFLGMALLIFYISTKYECQTGMESIRKLENRLEVVKTESIRERSVYMSRIRESSMAALADSVHPGLTIRPTPPFVLHLNQ